MSDEALWFEPVSLLSQCSLSEGLLWVWAERVPTLNAYREKNAFETLQDWECARLNIPPVPDGVRHAAQHRTEERLRGKRYAIMPADAREYHIAKELEEAAAMRQWLALMTPAMELAAAELFVKFRHGQIEATGKVLPEGAAVIDFLEDQNSYSGGDFDDLPERVIPRDLWTMPGIDWVSNAVTAHGVCYCDVSMPVDVLMTLFPGERTPAVNAQFVGDCLLVEEGANDSGPRPPRRAPGRPPAFAWDAFHVEVTDLIKSGQMPQKKEAAIHQMLKWFADTQNQHPSRSAVSEKLTPYYRRFFSRRDESH